MYKYFGTSADKVRTIIVTHSDEVKYMEGIATAEQIGNTTNSCAYVEPTNSGGIKGKDSEPEFCNKCNDRKYTDNRRYGELQCYRSLPV